MQTMKLYLDSVILLTYKVIIYLFILVTVQRTVKLDSSPEVHKYTQTQKHPPTIEMKTNTHTVLNEEK